MGKGGISKDLLLAILALDAYNRGYGAGIEGLSEEAGTRVRPASILDYELPEGAQNAGFYALAYKLDKAVEGLPKDSVIISYRGTDKNSFSFWKDEPGSDLWNGYGTGAWRAIPAARSASRQFQQPFAQTRQSLANVLFRGGEREPERARRGEGPARHRAHAVLPQ